MGEEAPGEDSSYFDSLRGLGESVVGVFSSDEEGPDYEGMSEKLAEDLKREDAKVPEEFLKKLASSPSPEDNKLWARLLETTAADENLTPKELELLDQRLLDEKNKFDMKEMIAGRDGKGPNFLKDIDFKNSEDIVYFADGKDVWMEVPCLSGGPIKVVSVDGGKKWKIDGLIYEYTDFKDAASDAMLIQTSLARFKLFSPDRDFFGDDNENPFRVDALGHIEFDANWLPLDARNFSALVKTGNHDEFTNEVYRRFKKMKAAGEATEGEEVVVEAVEIEGREFDWLLSLYELPTVDDVSGQLSTILEDDTIKVGIIDSYEADAIDNTDEKFGTYLVSLEKLADGSVKVRMEAKFTGDAAPENVDDELPETPAYQLDAWKAYMKAVTEACKGVIEEAEVNSGDSRIDGHYYTTISSPATAPKVAKKKKKSSTAPEAATAEAETRVYRPEVFTQTRTFDGRDAVREAVQEERAAVDGDEEVVDPYTSGLFELTRGEGDNPDKIKVTIDDNDSLTKYSRASDIIGPHGSGARIEMPEDTNMDDVYLLCTNNPKQAGSKDKEYRWGPSNKGGDNWVDGDGNRLQIFDGTEFEIHGYKLDPAPEAAEEAPAEEEEAEVVPPENEVPDVEVVEVNIIKTTAETNEALDRLAGFAGILDSSLAKNRMHKNLKERSTFPEDKIASIALENLVVANGVASVEVIYTSEDGETERVKLAGESRRRVSLDNYVGKMEKVVGEDELVSSKENGSAVKQLFRKQINRPNATPVETADDLREVRALALVNEVKNKGVKLGAKASRYNEFIQVAESTKLKMRENRKNNQA